MDESGPTPELLQAVADIDRSLWESSDATTITQRNEAVVAALSSGWTEEDLARAVGVRTDDVVRWSRAAAKPLPSP